MSGVQQFLTILTIGVIGGIVYTLATRPTIVDSAFNGLDKLYRTAAGATLGQVA